MTQVDLGFPAIDPVDAGFTPHGLSRIERWMDDYTANRRLAQFSFAVLHRGRVVFSRFSEADGASAEGVQLSPTTIHRIFSMTKPVTGVAMLRLLERGCYQLDDPVANYLEEFSEPQVLNSDGVLEPAARPISIRHMLTHTAGLSYGFLETSPVDQQILDLGLDAVPGHVKADSLEDWCQKISALPLVAHPGTRWHYSVAMDVLGRLIEVMTGRSFDHFVREEILVPLGMVDTDFHVPPDKHQRFATCYRHTDAGIQRIERRYKPFHSPPKIPLGGGGLVSTMVDYLRFCEMLRRGGELDGVRILSPASVELMMTDHLGHLPLDEQYRDAPLSTMPSMATFRGDGFGLTGMVTLDPSKSGVAGPAGPFAWGGAASTGFWVDRQTGLSVVQLAQLLPSSTYPLRKEARNLVYEALTGSVI